MKKKKNTQPSRTSVERDNKRTSLVGYYYSIILLVRFGPTDKRIR